MHSNFLTIKPHIRAQQEIFWFTSLGKKVTNENSTSSSVQLRGEKKNPSSELLTALTSETGPLAHGATPEVGGQGEKNVLEAVTNQSAQKAKAKTTKKKTEEAEEVVPKTPKERLAPCD